MSYDHRAIERECREHWERTGIYRFDPEGEGDIFAVDTPPPYVSAAHLHVGHAMSYTQAEFVVRWQRMKGRRPFYPMGFDDNGLPTERYVERVHGIDKRTTSRTAFRHKCLEETARGAQAYESLWRSLGLSVDWDLRYSTIDEHCQRTAQRSFLELFEAGRIYRSHDPVLWDPELQTSVAQADLDTLTRRQKLHSLAFAAEQDGAPLIIATTRPELLVACVALFRHPDDLRYQGLTGAKEPLEGRSVPVLADEGVDPAFGTGLMMVCTFGDAEDVRRWREHGLELRVRIGPDGRMTPDAGAYAGLSVAEARARIVKDLQGLGAYQGFEMTEQAVPIAERSGAPVEWQLAPQWFLRVLDLKPALLARSAELRWHPAHMKARLDHWIEGLKWDWNLSRQRYYGVPMPVWLCEACDTPVLARVEDLPVDPLEHAPPVDACPQCGGALRGDPDVMDTWMTSSLTPLINANWAGTPARQAGPQPMTVRVQGFEIIRTWLFYTVLKSHLHTFSLPWRDVMISGWGLNEQGRKISKRDLQKSTDPSGFNRYDPSHVIDRFGADALRHWAGRSHLGHDLRYHAKEIKGGRKVAVKLWNAGQLASMALESFDPAAPRPGIADRPLEDQDLLWGLDRVIETVDSAFEAYDYATGLTALDRFFFGTFCDDWLEMMKPRLHEPDRFPQSSRAAAVATCAEAFRALLGLYAPYLPFVTEALYQRLFAAREGIQSLHITTFPRPSGAPAVADMDLVRGILRSVRSARTAQRLPQSQWLAALFLHGLDPACLEGLRPTLIAACRARSVEPGAGPSASDAWPVDGYPVHVQVHVA